MKKFCVLLLLGCALPASAELVSEVTYNPSRLGMYEVLKVASNANLAGGLEVYDGGNLSIRSDSRGGRVDMTYRPAGTNAPAQPSFVIPTVTTNLPPGTNAWPDNVVVTVDMQDTVFMKPSWPSVPGKNNVPDWNASASSASPVYAGPSVQMFPNSKMRVFNGDSFITSLGQFDGGSDQRIHVSADTLVAGTLMVEGDSNTTGTPSPYRTQNIQQLLAGNPFVQSSVNGFNLLGHTIDIFPPSSPGGGGMMQHTCQLAWVKRYARRAVSSGGSIPVKKCILAYVCGLPAAVTFTLMASDNDCTTD